MLTKGAVSKQTNEGTRQKGSKPKGTAWGAGEAKGQRAP